MRASASFKGHRVVSHITLFCFVSSSPFKRATEKQITVDVSELGRAVFCNSMESGFQITTVVRIGRLAFFFTRSSFSKLHRLLKDPAKARCRADLSALLRSANNHHENEYMVCAWVQKRANCYASLSAKARQNIPLGSHFPFYRNTTGSNGFSKATSNAASEKQIDSPG